jgi:hypothetical protein
MLANPPIGVEWNRQEAQVEKEHHQFGFDGRFVAPYPMQSSPIIFQANQKTYNVTGEGRIVGRLLVDFFRGRIVVHALTPWAVAG